MGSSASLTHLIVSLLCSHAISITLVSECILSEGEEALNKPGQSIQAVRDAWPWQPGLGANEVSHKWLRVVLC